jgi:hypothetical protein
MAPLRRVNATMTFLGPFSSGCVDYRNALHCWGEIKHPGGHQDPSPSWPAGPGLTDLSPSRCSSGEASLPTSAYIEVPSTSAQVNV